MKHLWRKINGNFILPSNYDELRNTLFKEINIGKELKVCIGTDNQISSYLLFPVVIVQINLFNSIKYCS